MEKLTNKRYNSFDYTSRYTTVPYFYDTETHTDVYGIGTQMSSQTAFVSHLVRPEDTLDALAQMRDYGSALISGAPAAIVVMGDDSKTDLWVDNCAISATFVQLAVTAFDLVSCWVHCNGRPRLKDVPEGDKAEDYVRDLLGLKDGLRPYCVIAIGYPQD